jgi:hypothetical protein
MNPDINPNLSLELGDMRGRRKKCLLLKERRSSRQKSKSAHSDAFTNREKRSTHGFRLSHEQFTRSGAPEVRATASSQSASVMPTAT